MAWWQHNNAGTYSGDVHISKPSELTTNVEISVAVQVVDGNDQSLQKALSECYTDGELRGAKLRAVRTILRERGDSKQTMLTNPAHRAMTSAQLVNLYKERVAEQQRLVILADQTRQRSLTIVSAMRSLLADEDFHLVLESEGLDDMPEHLLLEIR